MKTSNKILLAILIVPLLVLTAVQAALLAKYKTGHYTAMTKVREDRFTRQTLKNISKIAVYGLNNFRIIPSDTLKLEIEKDTKSPLHYTIIGDSLVIHGESISKKGDGSDDYSRSYQAVNLYLPGGATITANNSAITLEGSKDSLKASSCHFALVNNAGFTTDDSRGNEGGHKYVKELSITADHSSGIALNENMHVFDLRLILVATEFADNGATIDKLQLEADKVSNITMKGSNLMKLGAAKQP